MPNIKKSIALVRERGNFFFVENRGDKIFSCLTSSLKYGNILTVTYCEVEIRKDMCICVFVCVYVYSERYLILCDETFFWKFLDLLTWDFEKQNRRRKTITIQVNLNQ